MRIHVGSTNPAKVQAVKSQINLYPNLKWANVREYAVQSGVSSQPKSLDEIVLGAVTRARNAFLADMKVPMDGHTLFEACDLSFGMESGIMEVPHVKSGWMDICACAIFDGHQQHIGLSSAFEAPKEIVDIVLKDGLEMSDAVLKAGITTNPKLGAAEGLIGLLTGGRVTRQSYTEQAIAMAIFHITTQH